MNYKVYFEFEGKSRLLCSVKSERKINNTDDKYVIGMLVSKALECDDGYIYNFRLMFTLLEIFHEKGWNVTDPVYSLKVKRAYRANSLVLEKLNFVEDGLVIG